MRSGTPSAAAWVLIAALLGSASAAAAAEIEGVRFADRTRSGATTFVLRCVGLLRYKLLFKGYVAGLWVGERTREADPLADVPKRMELSYFWAIAGEDFGPAGETVLRRNVSAATMQRLRPQLDQINALYDDVKPGDRYTLTYVPGVGTELALNGAPKGTIAGAEFAAAYFRIWLGPDPIDDSLRDQLLHCRTRNPEG